MGGDVRSSTVKATIVAIAVLAAQTCLAGAQILRRPAARTAPPNWIGGGVAIEQAFTLRDGITDSQWAFDGALGYTASFEHPTQSGIMVGLQGTYATPTMRYTSFGSSGGVNCPSSCTATSTVMQLMGLAHSANSYSLHGVYQLTVGATGFSNFRDSTSSQIGPKVTDYDFSFAIGYGIGFGLSPTAMIEVVQEIGTVLHQRTGLAAGSGNYPRMTATRLGGKLAF
jgi:hypothetical protein